MTNRCDDCGRFMVGGKHRSINGRICFPNICYTCDLDRFRQDQEMLSNA